mmetsp:Transcript_12822/g.40682  ORF Transcript_12822/g.40682 Transcript_12822/m.40682 type:complete len:316 (-) Transcript_12822:574-1521(-)
MVGGSQGAPETRVPVSAKRRTRRSCWVSQAGPALAASNCMSEKTMRSGTSSGATLWSTQAWRMHSMARSKLVLPPQGAAARRRTFSSTRAEASTECHRGWDSKVRTRLANCGAASSATRRPRAMATSMGVPVMLPETSTSATSFPRSTPRFSPSVATAFSAAAPARTSSTMRRHCASRTSASRTEAVWSRRIAAWTTSCGKSCLPLSFRESAAARSAARHATRSSSSGKRSPVSTSAVARGLVLLSFSLRKALRERARQSEGTASIRISRHRLEHIFTSATSSFAVSAATSCRYRFRASPASPYRARASALAAAA